MTDFSAKASSIGTLHQVRYGLVVLLGHEEATLQLEGLDDIDLSAEGDPDKLLQLKHRDTDTVLTDMDPDLWKTLRIWAEHIAEGRVDPTNAVFTLATTASAAPESAAALLRPDNTRDVHSAMAILSTVYTESKNKKLEKAFSAFRELGAARQRLLLERTFILDRSASIAASRAALEDRLAPTIRREHRVPLADRLEGWWFHQCVDLLRGARRPITGFEVFDQARMLAEQFLPSALPIDYFDASPSASEAIDLSRRQFVEQLECLGISLKRIENAVRDYYRAFVQRTRWATDQLLIGDEIERYEARLQEEWERIRDVLVDEVGENATEGELQQVGKEVLKWAEQKADLRIRPDVTEAFVLRGSFHILADSAPPKVWWHPEFMNRLTGIMEAES